MSKLTDSFRTVGVHNPHNFYNSEGGGLYIDYTPDGPSRSFISAHWDVCKIGQDLGESYRDYGCRPFAIRYTRSKADRHQRAQLRHGEAKPIALLEAQDFADKTFGKQTWVRDPFGSYGPEAFVKARIAELKEAAAAKVLA